MTIENNLYKSYCTGIIAKQKLKVYQLLLNNSLILFFPSPLQRENTGVSLSSNPLPKPIIYILKVREAK